MLKIFKIVILISVIGLCWFFYDPSFEEKDIYENRLLFFRDDSSLFNGKLIKESSSTIIKTRFVNGLPCGETSERQYGFDGPYVSKGVTYPINDVLSSQTISKLGTDTAWVYVGNEGGDESASKNRLIVFVLNNRNVELKSKSDILMKDLADSVLNDTRRFKYSSLYFIYLESIGGRFLKFKEFDIK
jgi:hypothetical protein